MAPTQPTQIRQIVTGYLRCQSKAADNYNDAQLEEILRSLNINMEEAPPFETVTATAGYASHGVVKINNVSSFCDSNFLRVHFKIESLGLEKQECYLTSQEAFRHDANIFHRFLSL